MDIQWIFTKSISIYKFQISFSNLVVFGGVKLEMDKKTNKLVSQYLNDVWFFSILDK